MKKLQSIVKALKQLNRYNVRCQAGVRLFHASTLQRFTLLFAFFILHSSFCLGYTITNISIGTDLNSAAWTKVNNNNNNFVAWLDADDLTNGYFYGVLTNIAPLFTNALPSLLAQSNRLNVVSNNFTVVSNRFVVVSNNFVTVSNQYSSGTAAVPVDSHGNGSWGTNGMNLIYLTPASGDTYYGIGGNGINDGTFPSIGMNGFIFENADQPLVDFAWAALDDDGGSWMNSARFEARSGYVLSGGAKELEFGWSADFIGGFGYLPCLLLGDNYSTATEGFSIGEGNVPTTPPANGLHVAGNVQFDAAFSSDGGNFTSDGSGNVTAQTFTPVSDRALKENIAALPPGQALDMALALTNFQWNFRARTNHVAVIARQAGFTNNTAAAPPGVSAGNVVAKINSPATNIATATSSASTNGNTGGINSTNAIAIAKKGLVTTTNLVQKIVPASGKQIGPMAQDWHAVTGLDDGRHISLTAMQGLLLGAIQDLAARQPTAGTVTNSTDGTGGHGAGLIRWDANYLYVSVGTNQWKRAALTGW